MSWIEFAASAASLSVKDLGRACGTLKQSLLRRRAAELSAGINECCSKVPSLRCVCIKTDGMWEAGRISSQGIYDYQFIHIEFEMPRSTDAKMLKIVFHMSQTWSGRDSVDGKYTENRFDSTISCTCPGEDSFSIEGGGSWFDDGLDNYEELYESLKNRIAAKAPASYASAILSCLEVVWKNVEKFEFEFDPIFPDE